MDKSELIKDIEAQWWAYREEYNYEMMDYIEEQIKRLDPNACTIISV